MGFILNDNHKEIIEEHYKNVSHDINVIEQLTMFMNNVILGEKHSIIEKENYEKLANYVKETQDCVGQMRGNLSIMMKRVNMLDEKKEE